MTAHTLRPTPGATPTERDPRWSAVVARDAAADGSFHYSVRTTGVYCRPSCAARLARPEHVRFHETTADAEAAGFRPCKRCRPGARAGVRGEAIRFAIGESPLGLVLVAASLIGISAVLLGDARDALRGDLQRRFPGATLTEGDEAHRALSERVIAFIASPARALDVPLDLRGTEFQRTVWRALREIPRGSTATYAEVARRIGMPRSARAVARACAANALAVLVPCHRVVRGDGSLAGYRWGVERKRALLAKEIAE
jgi:AraC family transcriptional regulator of adaptative response/methylated-DNA-[protein]-cysteine methyltransferase